ncbi:dolichol-phosphate mannose synthase subunit 3 isoform X2 [Durio zibethinus]|uniref:Dolichol-phosphate mannosyltransferase subunit 3 n=1 Tax=Durio zibethinus TaxID=66656 RepID=A0A6P6A1W2_DURZI|nr:dolichol-phosphate mannose synthase subunit 3 isoform X2 [Durio zibethinus]
MTQFRGRAYQKHVLKIFSLLVVISALWIGLLQASIIPQSHTWLLPIYFIVSLGCYGLLMVGVGLMRFPTCPQEALLLQQAGNMSFGWDLNNLLIC